MIFVTKITNIFYFSSKKSKKKIGSDFLGHFTWNHQALIEEKKKKSFACHVSHVTCNMSYVSCHVLHVMCHMSHVACHLLPNGNSHRLSIF